MATRKPRSPASQPLLVNVEDSTPQRVAPEEAEPAPAPPSKKKPAAPRAPKKKAARVPTLIEALSSFLAGTLVADLEQRAQSPAVERVLRRQWEQERAQNRSAEHYEGFRRRTCLQIGASWLLCCVFVRTLEDRGLLERRRLAGEGAEDSERLFFEQFPSLGHRDYLLAVFREVGKLPGASSVLGVGQAPAYRLGPSSEVARELLKIFRSIDDATGSLRYRFDGQDTRLLGDLYQDLSADIRERYALLQTPDFVEEFILDLTLTPAIDTFGLEQVRLIDPTCGSGHFLLGAFHRLVERHRAQSPNLANIEIASKALEQVHGVDLNPYAIAIARFRLTLAFVQVAGMKRLRDITEPLPLNLVVADSLLIAARKSTRRLGEFAPDAGYNDRLFDLEDPETAYKILGQGYHAVVGNPPYITCKDAALRDYYRELYDSAFRLFALAAPFTERFFQLGVAGGFVGLINANSFMKREFGKPLVEKVLPGVDLTHVVDTSGAFIPGHGTPTVILFGRNQHPITDSVRAVLGKRGEPSTPEQPEKGQVWLSIIQHIGLAEFENDFVSVVGVERTTFSKHPWSLGGGGAAELKALLEERAERKLASLVEAMGRVAHTGADEAYVAPRSALSRAGLGESHIASFVEGESLRDWSLTNPSAVVFPYDSPNFSRCFETAQDPRLKHIWPFRTILWLRREPNGTHREIGLTWYEFSRFHPERFTAPLCITFPFVATHNHFVLDRGGKVFKQTAPIIKLPAGATEDDHLALLGYLNSSTACFWMKQVFSPKGMHNGSEANATPFLVRFEFAGTAMSELPIPPWTEEQKSKLIDLAKALDASQQERNALSFDDIAQSNGTVKEVFEKIVSKRESLRFVGIALQEEIDWLIYESFGFCNAISISKDELEPIFDGERVFEIELGSSKASIGEEWARWNESKLATEVPSRLPPKQQISMNMRRSVYQKNAHVRMLESPENKRRWRQPSGKAAQELETDEKILKDQAHSWISSRLESLVKSLGQISSANSIVSDFIADVRQDEIVSWVSDVESPRQFLLNCLFQEAVPYLAAYRYSEAGMAKRKAWEETWALQRREDAGEKVEIPVPPKYDSKDFRRPEYWSLRGKLDVPKERFISYPGAEDEQGSPVLGWAGWDHLQRATALAGLYQERKEQQGWEGPRLIPLLAGLWELVPWLKQWHNEPSEEFQGERLGDYFAAFVIEEARLLGKTTADLEAWRPGK